MYWIICFFKAAAAAYRVRSINNSVVCAQTKSPKMDILGLLNTTIMGHAAWLWLTFSGIVVALLAFDLGVLNKNDHVIGLRESLLLSSGYIGIAVLFGALVWWQLGAPGGTAYF